MRLVSRWARHEAWMEEVPEDDRMAYAARADGALVIFDEDGYFLIVSTGPGEFDGEEVPNVLKLEDSEGNQEDFYCEPIWLSGYWDTFAEQYGGMTA